METKSIYYAGEILGYIEQNFTQYEGLEEEWTERQGEGGRYYFNGFNSEGDVIEVKVEVFGFEWSVEERLESDESWVLVDIFRVEE